MRVQDFLVMKSHFKQIFEMSKQTSNVNYTHTRQNIAYFHKRENIEIQYYTYTGQNIAWFKREKI